MYARLPVDLLRPGALINFMGRYAVRFAGMVKIENKHWTSKI